MLIEQYFSLEISEINISIISQQSISQSISVLISKINIRLIKILIERSISQRSISGTNTEIDVLDQYRDWSLRLIQRLVSKIGLWISEIDL